jgi:hypothetical protein
MRIAICLFCVIFSISDGFAQNSLLPDSSIAAGTVKSSAQAPKTLDEGHFRFYGFGRTVFTLDDQNLGGSDLFVPANIKVGQTKEPNFFITAKQTRAGFDYTRPHGSHLLKVKLEGDFHNDASNSTGLLRMRHAYAEYKYLTVGMTWSNFFDEGVNPTVVDFEGPNSSTLSRTPQLKFSTFKSKNTLSVSFENPNENVTLGGSIKALPIRFPDLITAYKFNGKHGFVKLAGLLRELRYDSDKSRSLIGYGVNLMSLVNISAADKLRIQVVGGTGIARYIQGVSGLNYDAVFDSTNTLKKLDMYGLNVSYQHFWRRELYSSLTAGFLNVEKNKNLTPGNYWKSYYASVNLFYEVFSNLSFGYEVLAGERVDINGEKQSAVRLQMNATYKFNQPNK